MNSSLFVPQLDIAPDSYTSNCILSSTYYHWVLSSTYFLPILQFFIFLRNGTFHRTIFSFTFSILYIYWVVFAGA